MGTRVEVIISVHKVILHSLPLLLFLVHIAHSSIVTADFSQGTDGWNHGQGLWVTTTNANGLSINNPYLYLDPIGTSPKRGVIVWNDQESWTGNYSSKGVTSIRFYARNAGLGDPLYFRIAIGNTRNPMSGTWFVSDNLRVVQNNDGWSLMNFDLNSNTMVKASSAMENGSPGSGSFNDVFTDVAAIRIISQGSAFSAVAQDHYGDVYIDSVALIPEPHTVRFITLSSLLLALRRNAHRKNKSYLRSQLTPHLPQVEDRFTTQNPDF